LRDFYGNTQKTNRRYVPPPPPQTHTHTCPQVDSLVVVLFAEKEFWSAVPSEKRGGAEREETSTSSEPILLHYFILLYLFVVVLLAEKEFWRRYHLNKGEKEVLRACIT
jgi:hypothetical protein